MSTAPAFLFDLDGTLAWTLGDIAASTNHVRAKYGLEPVGPDVVRSFIGDGARILLARALAERLTGPDGNESVLDEAFLLYLEHHERQCTVTAKLYPGAREFLDNLHAMGHPMAIVTNKPERFAVRIAHHLRLADRISIVIGGDTLPVRKPDPAPLQSALDRLGVDRMGATMVGDGIQDLRAGKALGLRTIGCLFGFTDADRLRAEEADVYWQTFGG